MTVGFNETKRAGSAPTLSSPMSNISPQQGNRYELAFK